MKRLLTLLLTIVSVVVLHGQVNEPVVKSVTLTVVYPITGKFVTSVDVPASYFSSGLVFPQATDSMTVDSAYFLYQTLLSRMQITSLPG
jgi:hypothetical protein